MTHISMIEIKIVKTLDIKLAFLPYLICLGHTGCTETRDKPSLPKSHELSIVQQQVEVKNLSFLQVNKRIWE